MKKINESRFVRLHASLFINGKDDSGIDAHSVCSENATAEDRANALIALIEYDVGSPADYDAILKAITTSHDEWVDNYKARSNLTDEEYLNLFKEETEVCDS